MHRPVPPSSRLHTPGIVCKRPPTCGRSAAQRARVLLGTPHHLRGTASSTRVQCRSAVRDAPANYHRPPLVPVCAGSFAPGKHGNQGWARSTSISTDLSRSFCIWSIGGIERILLVSRTAAPPLPRPRSRFPCCFHLSPTLSAGDSTSSRCRRRGCCRRFCWAIILHSPGARRPAVVARSRAVANNDQAASGRLRSLPVRDGRPLVGRRGSDRHVPPIRLSRAAGGGLVAYGHGAPRARLACRPGRRQRHRRPHRERRRAHREVRRRDG